jgi:hypothetical protein
LLENCVPRGRFVELERLRIEFGSKSLNLLFADPQSTGAEGLPNGEVFKIAPAHSH